MESLVSRSETYSRQLSLPRHTGSKYLSKDSNNFITLDHKPTIPSSLPTQLPSIASQQAEVLNMKPTRENCDRRRPGEDDASRLPNISQHSMSQSVTPFLREHIPTLYAPIGKPDLPSMMNLKNKDPNSKYCYRHRPDSKCRRAADESKMALIQSVRWYLISLVTT
jgi:hypothetical protein